MSNFDPRKLRKTVLEMAYAGSTVHIACAFSIIEILAVLYRSHLNLGDRTVDAQDRDFLVLSKGHGVMAQYACMRELGWLKDKDISNYFGDGTLLKGLSDGHVPGLEVTSGSLGHGLSVGVGLALAAKRKGTGQRCFAIVGDGELNEGAIWEAMLFAAQVELSNLLIIVDANGFQAMGRIDEIIRLESIADKFKSFGFETRDIDGHDQDLLTRTIDELMRLNSPAPRALVARTIKGQGISFMANDNRWHYTRLSPESYAKALAELEEQGK
ncbi:MAG: transketolase [Leptospirales bacterium]|nr:transketolase [Leptospirales bacterium]